MLNILCLLLDKKICMYVCPVYIIISIYHSYFGDKKPYKCISAFVKIKFNHISDSILKSSWLVEQSL